MAIFVTHDSITPTLKRLPKRLRANARKETNRIVRKGMQLAKRRVSGQRSQDLKKNIGYMPAQGKKPAVLYSTNKRSLTGFPYELWVNRDIKKITGRRPYFNNGIQVGYGDGRVKAQWRMTPGYFTITVKDMSKMMPKGLRRIWRRSIR